MMTQKEKAIELVTMFTFQRDEHEKYVAKQCALIAVDEIINANPHSNPLNTYPYSTMAWWRQVKSEIEKL